MWKLYADGACRGNGHKSAQSSIGGVLYNPQGKVVFTFSETINDQTNNVAEYKALIRGLQKIQEEKIDIQSVLTIYMDSKLVICQCKDEYKVKAEHLKPLKAQVKSALCALNCEVRLIHIPRSQNSVADGLANSALESEED